MRCIIGRGHQQGRPGGNRPLYTAQNAYLRHIIEEGHRTADIASPGERTIGTREMADLVLAKIGA